MTKQELILLQAGIRDKQKERIEHLHMICHEVERWYFAETLVLDKDQECSSANFMEMVRELHLTLHEFMTDMDHAVLIHAQIARLEGRNPNEVSGILWPVQNQPATLDKTVSL